MTSIVMMVESTYDATSGRGTTVPGLRAPDPGTAPDVTGAFTIDGVPPGKYVVLAAFENDDLVRDPDPCIAGHRHRPRRDHRRADHGRAVLVQGDLGGDPDRPRRRQPEAVTSAPTLQWVAYPSTQYYDVSVFDSFGTDVWDTQVTGDLGRLRRAPRRRPVLPGPGLRREGQRQPDLCLLSSTEDLRGVFYVP